MEMTYEQTVELEKNVKFKNEANEIYQKFLKNIKLDVKKYKGNGSFLHWADSHNAIYITLIEDKFYFQCRFLNEKYDIEITPSGIFNALKTERSGIEHLISDVEAR